MAIGSRIASAPVPPTLTARSSATYLPGIAAPWDRAVDLSPVRPSMPSPLGII